MKSHISEEVTLRVTENKNFSLVLKEKGKCVRRQRKCAGGQQRITGRNKRQKKVEGRNKKVQKVLREK